jgi:hypothetical protein
VIISEPGSMSNSDVLRFENGLVSVFSDVESGEPLDKADVGLPTLVPTSTQVTETGLNGMP